MLINEQRAKVLSLVMGSLLALDVLLLTVPSSRACLDKGPDAKAENANDKQNTGGFISLVICSGRLINDSGPLIAAIATGFIAFFTFTLKRSTDKLWEAGERQQKFLKNSAERQLRAYVGVDGMSYEITSGQAGYIPTDPNAIGVIYPDFLAIKVRNFGQTPAKNVRIIVGVVNGPHLMRLAQEFDYDAILSAPLTSKNIITRAHLNKDQTEILKNPVFDARDIWNTRAQKAGTIIFGQIYYTDAFDRNWSTKFCYVWEPWHGPGERFVPYETFNGEDQRDPPP